MNWAKFLRHFAGWCLYSIVVMIIISSFSFRNDPFEPTFNFMVGSALFSIFIGVLGACFSASDKEDKE